MINNQIPTLASSNVDLFTGKGGNDAENPETKAQGGLFKLWMNSVQQESDGKNQGELHGEILLPDQKEADAGGDVSLADVLAGLDENTKRELIKISELLNGTGGLLSGEKILEEEKGDEAISETDLSAAELAINGEQAELFVDSNEPATKQNLGDGAVKTVAGDQSALHGTFGQQDASVPGLNGTAEEETADTELPGKSGSALNGTGENVASPDNFGSAESDLAKEAAGLPGAETVLKGDSSDKKDTQPQKGLSGELKDGTQTTLFQSLAADGLQTDQKSGDVKQEPIREVKQEGISEGTVHRESGRVSQLRAFASSHPLAVQQTEAVPAASVPEVKSGDSESVQKMFADLANGNLNQEAAEVRSLKANQIREIRYSNYQSGLSNRLENGFSGIDTSTSHGAGATASDPNKSNMMTVSGVAPVGVSASVEQIDHDAAAMWKEHIAEYFESKEKSSAEQASALTKLNDFAVTNISVRKNFAMSIGQAIMSATGEGKKAAETWQKHTFKLDNGSNIQLSAREVDGVLQLRLSSSSPELNKLLTDHQDEIREHLGKEIDIQIDLQLDTQGDGQQAGFLNRSGGQEQRGSQFLDGNSAKTTEQAVEEVVPKAVRKFGYNQMEWTA